MSGGSSGDNSLSISWHDSAWIPILNPGNVMDYFAERSNPFYDRTCNNEIIKMQRLNPDQINNMTGIEYILLHVQEPILYVIRKQDRHTASQVTPLADYYIIAGVVYQAPDLGSVINSRMLNTMHSIQAAFSEAHSYSKYHPSKGYWWKFKEKEETEKKSEKDKKKKEEPSSAFQRQRVDELLVELAKKYPPKIPTQPAQAALSTAVAAHAAGNVAGSQTTGGTQAPVGGTGHDQNKMAAGPIQIKQEIKQEKIDIKVEKPDDIRQDVIRQQHSSMKPPPDKKMKLLR